MPLQHNVNLFSADRCKKYKIISTLKNIFANQSNVTYFGSHRGWNLDLANLLNYMEQKLDITNQFPDSLGSSLNRGFTVQV